MVRRRWAEGPFCGSCSLALLMWACSSLGSVTGLSDPWAQCPTNNNCRGKFADGLCHRECSSAECLRDGFDCLKGVEPCNQNYTEYCKSFYGNTYCERGCNSALCGWDGSDCFLTHKPQWASGTLLIHTNIPVRSLPVYNTSLLWAVSILLRTSLKLRGVVPFNTDRNLFTLQPGALADLLAHRSNNDSNGSLLYLQVDNRPCGTQDSSCFTFTTEAANYLRALKLSGHMPASPGQELLEVRGVRAELGDRDSRDTNASHITGRPPWLWAVVGVAAGLLLLLSLLVAVVLRRLSMRRQRKRGDRVRHISTVTDSEQQHQAWASHTPHRGASNGMRKNKGKESGKRRSEPLGEDAIRMRPLKKDSDVGSDTDITQSSLEDISQQRGDTSIRDHRPEEHKRFLVTSSQPQSPTRAPSRGWDRNASPAHGRTGNNSNPTQWCGPDGSVVLIRAVRSGLDRVVLELLRAGVPVNNTDHTGRSALHWACSVNNHPLARTLVRYGAAVDLQDYKGETALFLSALHGCYDSARLLLLHGASPVSVDRRGRQPLDVAREGLHHQLVELLLAHRPERAVATTSPSTQHHYPQCQWPPDPGLPSRSASFSGVVGPREALTPHQGDQPMGRRPSPQHWRSQSPQQPAALVPSRAQCRSPRPISTLQEVTSEEEECERPREGAITHAVSPLPAPRQRSLSCTQHALQRRSATQHRTECAQKSATVGPGETETRRTTTNTHNKIHSEPTEKNSKSCSQSQQAERGKTSTHTPL